MKAMTRRDFLANGTVLGAAMVVPTAWAQGSDRLKVGLIGCGGRGTGAVIDTMAINKGLELWAMGDTFKDRLEGSAKALREPLKDNFKVTGERMFTGFDSYEKVIASGVDVVILAAPPGFRPAHLKASIDAGKHVFMEKPVAVDGPGVRTVLEASELATKKNLSIVAGTQRRHDLGYREVIQRIHDGAIGELVAGYAYWNQGGLWMHPRQSSWSDMEWQMRNWLYFAWLSGDHIVEQHIHNIDVVNWAFRAHPVKATGLGGRQVRTDPAYGHVFDHFTIEYEYENGAKMHSMCRQIDNTASRVAESVVGTKGSSNCGNAINGSNGFYFQSDRPNPYELEHKHLIEAIRGGKPINEGRQVAESTLTAIMGRMSAYTGQEITWQQALESQESLMPDKLEFGELAVAPVATPGKTSYR
jgi:predicted dehydrogenase